jgi:Na+/phosphate symporter
MGAYDDIVRAIREYIAPELKDIKAELKGLQIEIKRLDEKIDSGLSRLDVKIDSAKSEILSEIRRLDTRVDSIEKELKTAIEIRERLTALETEFAPKTRDLLRDILKKAKTEETEI